MQFTFSVDHPAPAAPNVVNKPDLRPSVEFKEATVRRGRQATRTFVTGEESSDPAGADYGFKDSSPGSRKRKNPITSQEGPILKFPSLFSNDFGPSALLSASLSLTTALNYGEDVTNTSSQSLSILRPTIELPLDELLTSVDSPEENPITHFHILNDVLNDKSQNNDVIMQDTQPGWLHFCHAVRLF